MITPSQALKTSLALLGAAFDKKADRVVADAYWQALRDLTPEEIGRATQRALIECRFMPAPAELRQFAGWGRKRETDTAIAWEAVRSAIARHDYTTSVDFGPLVNAVVRNLGGWQRLCALGRDALDVWARKEFERIYGLFADVQVASLHGEPHAGAFGGRPVWIQIGETKRPTQQIAAAPNELQSLVRELADQKATG